MAFIASPMVSPRTIAAKFVGDSLCSTSRCFRRANASQKKISARLVPLSTGVTMEVVEVPEISFPSTFSSSGAVETQLQDKPPLIFVHGSLHAAWCFRLFQRFFAQRGFQTYALSLRGNAGSQIEQQTSPAVEEHIADLTALMKELNLASAPIVIAHSIGGFIAQKWIELDPSLNVSRLVLMASTPPSGNKKIVWRTLFRKGIGLSVRITMAFVKRTAATNLETCREMFFSAKDSSAYSEEWEGDQKLAEYMELLQLSRPTLDVKSLKKTVKGTGALKGNVFVIGGLLDNLIDRDALEEAAEFWGADLQLVEDAPHDLMLYSRWEDIASSVLDWINESLSLERAEESVAV